MQRRIFALGIDAASSDLVDRWTREGVLPHLSRLKAQGSSARLRTVEFHRTEAPWITFLTGCLPSRTGEWGHSGYDPERYTAYELPAYRFHTPPFYALIPNRRVAVVDPPLARPTPGLAGIEVLGWGVEANQCLRTSSPPGLLSDLERRFGPHPMFRRGSLPTELGSEPPSAEGPPPVGTYRLPSMYDVEALSLVRHSLLTGLWRREAIIGELWRREPWDLFFAVIGEGHTAGHLFWHLSQEHPLKAAMAPLALPPDPLRDVYQAIDAVIGRLAAQLPPDVVLVVFSIHGMIISSMDTSSTVFLPELLYRWTFSGRAALAASDGGSVPPPRTDYPRHWRHEMWDLRTVEGDRDLDSPAEQERCGDPFDWQPTNWYRRCWPAMKAFALPSYAEGMIRLNVRGRDAAGQVPSEDFAVVCDDIERMVHRLVDARTGRPIVRSVQRTRRRAEDEGIKGLVADMVVHWQEDRAIDVVDSPEVGRIGPVPYFRTGAHDPRGFMIARGPGISAGRVLDDATAPDLTATLLALLGASPPQPLDGRPLLEV